MRQNASKIPDKAPAGPKILYWLEAKIAAIAIAQMALMIPCNGVAQLAIAKERDKGILTIATTRPDFRLFLHWVNIR